MPYELRTFGGLNLLGPDGEPAEGMLAHSKGMALLVYLAVEAPEEGMGRSQAAALLWPNREEQRARSALRNALTRLRQGTESPLIKGKDERVLRPARERLETDVWAFSEALNRGDVERALSLYRGDFLAGFQVADAPPFERWADQQRERFRDRAHEAALAAGRAARETGSRERATAAFGRALELRPFRQEAAVELVRTLAEQGRPAEALQRYEAFRTRREEELELSPPEELERLVERIRAGEVERQGEGAEEPAQAADPPDPKATRPEGEAEGGTESGASPGAREPEDRETEDRFGGRSFILAVAVLGLMVVAFGLWRWQVKGSGGSGPPAGNRSVAVLPFETVGPDESGPVAEGLHTDLISRLSNVSDLKVISGTSVERFRGTEIPLPAIADSLGVRWVVEGDVQQSDGAIQVNAQLIHPQTETHAWADRYRRDLTAADLFDLQSEITKKIARSLEAELTPQETGRVERRPTEDLDAYKLYVQGRSRLDTRTEEGMREAVDYFKRAIEQDSTYALAWSGLADAIGLFKAKAYASPEDSLPDQEATARRALELGSDLAEAHASMGFVHFDEHNAPAALRELKRAVELKPSYAQAHHWLGWLQIRIGRLDAGHKHVSLSVALNPQHAAAREVLVSALIAQGNLQAAERHLQPMDLPVEPRLKAGILYHARRWDELETLAREQLAADRGGPAPEWRFYLSRIAVVRGDTATAREHLAELSEAEDYFGEGFLHAALGETDEAFSAWEHVAAESWDGDPLVSLRYWYSDILDPLRHDPRYRELIREINQAWGLNPDGSLPNSVSETSG